MKTVITVVGTSIFSNYQKVEDNLNDKIEDLELKSFFEWDNCKYDIDKIKVTIKNWINDNASAEIKSILKLKKEFKEISVQLIATDTILSPLSAEIVGEYIQNKNIETRFDKSSDIIKGLQVEDAKKFEKGGLVNLINRIHDIINEKYYENIILNITGGYKAIIPYITILGQVNDIPIYYIFEDADKLIRIPQAPVDINWSMFEKYADTLEKLDEGITQDWENYKMKNNIGEDFSSCIWEENGMSELNAVGKIFYEKYKNFFLVKIVKGSNLFKENEGNRNEVKAVFRELYERIMNEIKNNHIDNSEDLKKYIIELGEKNDLRHGKNPDKDKFIFKSTKKTQVRFVYSPEFSGRNLVLKVYDYVRGNFNHGSYITEFKKKWKVIKEIEFVEIPIKKPND